MYYLIYILNVKHLNIILYYRYLIFIQVGTYFYISISFYELLLYTSKIFYNCMYNLYIKKKMFVCV